MYRKQLATFHYCKYRVSQLLSYAPTRQSCSFNRFPPTQGAHHIMPFAERQSPYSLACYALLNVAVVEEQ